MKRSANADISYARANVAMAQANYDRAQRILTDEKPLADKEEISRQQFDQYINTARVAESQLQAARDKVTAAIQDAETKKAGMAGRASPHCTGARGK